MLMTMRPFLRMNRFVLLAVSAGWGLVIGVCAQAQARKPLGCRAAVIEGEVEAGKPFSHPIGNGLRLYLQPIASGWIVRVLPLTGPPPAHDAAELATPPYESVSPLSVSTDFAFRAQDAIAWNPRRFHYAASPASFQALASAYGRLMAAGKQPAPAAQAELTRALAATYAGTLTILDARIELGFANQWRMAEPMAQHLDETPHTVVDTPAAASAPEQRLGRILSLRFHVELTLPPGSVAATGVKVVPQPCSAATL
jgi:hypothetical protein